MPLPLFIAGASAAVSAISGIADGISSIFGGKNEDKSATGFNNFLNSNQHGAWSFPPALWMTDLFNRMGWPKDILANMQRTYDQANGKFQHGDWNCIVSSLAPVTIDLFKGAGEHNVLKSSVTYTAPSANIAPSVQSYTQASQQVAGYNGVVNTTGPAQPGQSQNSIVNATANIMDLIDKANQAAINLTGSPIVDTKAMDATIAQTIAQNPSNNAQGNPAGSSSGSPTWLPWAIAGGVALAVVLATRKK